MARRLTTGEPGAGRMESTAGWVAGTEVAAEATEVFEVAEVAEVFEVTEAAGAAEAAS